MFKKLPWGFTKTGKFKARFLWQSLESLRNQLKARGANLKIEVGRPAEVLTRLAVKYQADAVFASKEVASEEVGVEQQVEKALWNLGISLNLFQTNYLVHPEDLPFPIRMLPDVFTNFRKAIEKDWTTRPLLETPPAITAPNINDWGSLPALRSMLGDEWFDIQEEEPVCCFTGGSEQALKRLQRYFWEEDRLKEYKTTRNGLLGQGYSSKFSPWLALGCISPIQVYHEVKRYEVERVANESTYWLIIEFLWRDYFRFVFKKYGNKFFQEEGLAERKPDTRWNKKLFWKWVNGQTGNAFVDANMRELRLTGFMSNRGRQNVASFLVKDLNLDWVAGAAWFEHALIDYDVHSNWGNWAYVAGVGNDPRENRYFNTQKQAAMYDPDGSYTVFWLSKSNEKTTAA